MSAVLTGARLLTKVQTLKLAEFFGIAPAAFFYARWIVADDLSSEFLRPDRDRR